MTTGIALAAGAWHPHRDTWYSAPMFQDQLVDSHLWSRPITRWRSIPRYWNVAVPNTSSGRPTIIYGTSSIVARTRLPIYPGRPSATATPRWNHGLGSPGAPVVPAGDHLVSAAQMHSAYRIRRVKPDSLVDVNTTMPSPGEERRAWTKPRTGTTMRDLRGSNLAHTGRYRVHYDDETGRAGRQFISPRDRRDGWEEWMAARSWNLHGYGWVRVLVTGGTGFLASHPCHRLVEAGGVHATSRRAAWMGGARYAVMVEHEPLLCG